MSNATFTHPDLTRSAAWMSSVSKRSGNASNPTKAVLACRVVEPDRWCRRCGCEGAPPDTVVRRLAHEPLGDDPHIGSHIRRYRCADCGHVWRQDTTAAAEPRAKLSRVRCGGPWKGSWCSI